MHMNEVSYPDAVPIDGYGPGFFRVGGTLHTGALLVTPTGITAWGGYDETAPLLALVNKVDVLFIGTGAEIAHLPAAFRSELETAGLGVETMNSPAACRTYNVLLAEGRRIGAALLPV